MTIISDESDEETFRLRYPNARKHSNKNVSVESKLTISSQLSSKLKESPNLTFV